MNADNLHKTWSTLTSSFQICSLKSRGWGWMETVYHTNSFCSELSCIWCSVPLMNLSRQIAYQGIPHIWKIHEWCWNSLFSISNCMPPQIFIRAADMCPIKIWDLLPSDVCFKVLLFAGNLTETQVAELKLLAEELSKSSSFLHKYSPDGNFSTVFDIITITVGKKDDINYNYLLIPAFFCPHWSKRVLFSCRWHGRLIHVPITECFWMILM